MAHAHATEYRNSQLDAERVGRPKDSVAYVGYVCTAVSVNRPYPLSSTKNRSNDRTIIRDFAHALCDDVVHILIVKFET
jgi:hypothetical protein